MTRVTVTFVPWLHERVGAKEQVVELENGATVGTLLGLLAHEYGEDMFDSMLQTKNGPPGILVLCNQEVVLDMERLLSDGDEVGFVIPLSGG